MGSRRDGGRRRLVMALVTNVKWRRGAGGVARAGQGNSARSNRGAPGRCGPG